MIIHVVQPGDTVVSIAAKYQITVERLIQDNGLIDSQSLVIGQTLVIANPEQTYTVQEGDSLNSIADNNHITLKQLLRNNPYLSDRENIYPGETLVISYHNTGTKIATNGYAYPFIDKKVLRKTLPYLTYLSVFNYQATTGGEIVGIEDTDIVQIAKDYGVAPLMLLTTLSRQGEANVEVGFNILLNEQFQERLIDRILELLNKNGYYGVNMTFLYISPSTIKLYENFLARITSRLNSVGYPVFITINPRISFLDDDISFEKVDYSVLGKLADGVTFLTYDWGFSESPPVPNSVYMSKKFFDYAITQIPLEKLYIGIPVIGYDWPIPFVAGTTKATSLTFDNAVALAKEVGETIKYDELHQAAYYRYVESSTGRSEQHIVWFKDARSIDALVKLVPEYGIRGIAIWNIMQYFTQMWLVINTQYEIETIPL